MSDKSPLKILQQYASQFRLIAFLISTFSVIFLGFMLFIGEQRMVDPQMFSVFYLGIVIGAVQVPLSFYIWKYIPQRLPPKLTEHMLVTGFRMTMVIAFLLCLGVVLFAGLAAVISGYSYPSAILGGIALGSMLFHWPGNKRFIDFLDSLQLR